MAFQPGFLYLFVNFLRYSFPMNFHEKHFKEQLSIFLKLNCFIKNIMNVTKIIYWQCIFIKKNSSHVLINPGFLADSEKGML